MTAIDAQGCAKDQPAEAYFVTQQPLHSSKQNAMEVLSRNQHLRNLRDHGESGNTKTDVLSIIKYSPNYLY